MFARNMKTILITGVSRGIGRALAEKFLESGDEVVGTSTTGSASWSHERLVVLPLDLASAESIANCADAAARLGKRIDILVNNAGIYSGVDENPTIDVSHLRKTMEVNLFGTVDFTERIIPLLNGGGHIVNVSSRMGSLEFVEIGGINWPDYKISKAALNMVTRILAFRLQNQKIIVSSVHPGWVKTDMGGSDADLEPAEAAEDLYKLATSTVETGQFWFKGDKFPW